MQSMTCKISKKFPVFKKKISQKLNLTSSFQLCLEQVSFVNGCYIITSVKLPDFSGRGTKVQRTPICNTERYESTASWGILLARPH